MAISQKLQALILFVVCGTWPNAAKADAIVVTKAMTATTIAEIFVEQESIRVELEIGEKDIPAFQNLLPDEAYQRLTSDDTPMTERRAKYFRQDFLILVDSGEPISGEVRKIEQRKRLRRDEITGQPIIASADESQLVWFVELYYPLRTRPKSLSLAVPSHDQSQFPDASIGFVLYHMGLPITDFRYLSAVEDIGSRLGRSMVFSIQEPQPASTVLTRRSSFFLYVEYFEVRKEIIVRPRDLQNWLNLDLSGETLISVHKQEELKKRVADFLLERDHMTIDGKNVRPKLDRIHFVRRTLRKTGVIEPAEDLDLNSATLGVIFVYPIAKGLPKTVRTKWDLFNERIQKVPAVATDQAGGLPTTLTIDDPVLEWENFLLNPKVPAMLAIRPPPHQPKVSFPWISVSLVVVIIGLLSRFVRKPSDRPRWNLLVFAVLLVPLRSFGREPSLGLVSPILETADDQRDRCRRSTGRIIAQRVSLF